MMTIRYTLFGRRATPVLAAAQGTIAKRGENRRALAAVRPTELERVPGEKLGVVVARQIEAEILDRGFPVGEVVGSEAGLIERYGVSRAVLREAIRLLEHRNVAAMRRGPGGGL